MISPQVLRRYPQFAGLSEGDLREIAGFSRVRDFEVGEELFSEGGQATRLVLVMTGVLEIVYELGDGERVVADRLVSGDSAAWSALIEPHTLTASGVAGKGGAVLEIEAEPLRRMCQKNTDFGYRMMKELARVLRDRLSAMRVQVAAAQARLG
jgi:CRP-like cAMP-binding protein